MRKRRTFCQRMQYASSTTDPLRQPGRGGVLHHTGRRRGGNGGSRVPGAPNVRKGEGNPTTHADECSGTSFHSRNESTGTTKVSKPTSSILFQLWKSGSLCLSLIHISEPTRPY